MKESKHTKKPRQSQRERTEESAKERSLDRGSKESTKREKAKGIGLREYTGERAQREITFPVFFCIFLIFRVHMHF